MFMFLCFDIQQKWDKWRKMMVHNFKKRIEKGDGLRSRERERREMKFDL